MCGKQHPNSYNIALIFKNCSFSHHPGWGLVIPSEFWRHSFSSDLWITNTWMASIIKCQFLYLWWYNINNESEKYIARVRLTNFLAHGLSQSHVDSILFLHNLSRNHLDSNCVIAFQSVSSWLKFLLHILCQSRIDSTFFNTLWVRVKLTQIFDAPLESRVESDSFGNESELRQRQKLESNTTLSPDHPERRGGSGLRRSLRWAPRSGACSPQPQEEGRSTCSGSRPIAGYTATNGRTCWSRRPQASHRTESLWTSAASPRQSAAPPPSPGGCSGWTAYSGESWEAGFHRRTGGRRQRASVASRALGPRKRLPT